MTKNTKPILFSKRARLWLNICPKRQHIQSLRPTIRMIISPNSKWIISVFHCLKKSLPRPNGKKSTDFNRLSLKNRNLINRFQAEYGSTAYRRRSSVRTIYTLLRRLIQTAAFIICLSRKTETFILQRAASCQRIFPSTGCLK